MGIRRALVLLPVLAVVLVACGTSDPGGALYANLGCPRCHGPRGDGTPRAPELKSLGEVWADDGKLVAFLTNPQTAIDGDPRLEALTNRYAVPMTAVRGVSDQDLRLLASWLRSR